MSISLQRRPYTGGLVVTPFGKKVKAANRYEILLPSAKSFHGISAYSDFDSSWQTKLTTHMHPKFSVAPVSLGDTSPVGNTPRDSSLTPFDTH